MTFEKKMKQTTKQFFNSIDYWNLVELRQKANDFQGSYSHNDLSFQIYLICEDLKIDTEFLNYDEIIRELKV